jgi:hypothetical protein
MVEQGRVEVLDRLRTILVRHSAGMKVDEGETGVTVLTPALAPNGDPLWFGAVRAGKAYVSYHLIPIYASPELLGDVSPALRKRMQGKSCFNFTRVDEALFAELDELTGRGAERFRERGWLVPGARVRRDGSVEAPG